MYRLAEVFLTLIFLAAALVAVVVAVTRARHAFGDGDGRVPLSDPRVGPEVAMTRPAQAVGLLVFVLGFVLAATGVSPTALVPDYAEVLLYAALSAWAVLEVVLSLSVSDRWLGATGLRRLAFFGAAVVPLVLGAYLLVRAVPTLVYPPVAESVLLHVPVRGEWLARDAGAATLGNYHGRDPRQRYGVDLVKLDGGRIFEGRGAEYDEYHGYGARVFAPIGGRVTQVVNGVEDSPLGRADAGDPAGNVVVIDADDGRYVVLAHLLKGSVAVSEGDFVLSGEQIARVGNSGTSEVPHLHLHVQDRPRFDYANSEGRGFPFRFHAMRRERWFLWQEVDDGFLRTNDVFAEVER